MSVRSELAGRVAIFRDQAIGEYDGNRRVRLMTWLAIYISIVWLIVAVSEMGENRSKKVLQLATEERVISTYETVEDWSRRLTHEQYANKALREMCWEGDTPGVASADIQTFLQQRLNEHEMESARLKLSEAVQLRPKDTTLWSIKAEISGKMEKSNFPPLISALEFGDNGLQINRLRHLDQRSGLTNLLITTCISIGRGG